MRGTSLIANVLQDNVGDELLAVTNFTATLSTTTEDEEAYDNFVTAKIGETKTLQIQFEDGAGSAVDLSGMLFVCTVKNNITDDDNDAVLQKKSSNGDTEIEIISVDGGIIQIKLTSTDTALLENKNYIWDCRVEDNSGRKYYPIRGVIQASTPVTDYDTSS